MLNFHDHWVHSFVNLYAFTSVNVFGFRLEKPVLRIAIHSVFAASLLKLGVEQLNNFLIGCRGVLTDKRLFLRADSLFTGARAL
jgi:hypothetical protein